MKRMNEVLCRSLPITGAEVRHIIINETTVVDDDAIAHAINNVDALADALERLIPYCFGGSEESMSAWAAAKDALTAYRGAK